MWRVVGSSLLWLQVCACSSQAAPPTTTAQNDKGAAPPRASAERADARPAAAPSDAGETAAGAGAGAAASTASSPAAATPTTRGEVVLVPLGKFPADQVAAVAEHLRIHAQVDVRTHAREPLPEAAWYAPRKRYRADRILEHLEAMFVDAPATTHVLALVTVDISTTKPPHEDWGIFGLGQMPGRAAVVSTFRLRRKARDDAHLKRRLANTTLHELGHTFGLDHCREALCPMQDAEGSIVNTDAANDDFGPGCRESIERLAPLRVASPP